MYFQQRARAADGGARADVGRTGHRLGLEPEYLHRENTLDRRHLAMQVDVGSRKPEGTAEPVAMGHTAAHAVGPPQQLFREPQVAGRERRADARARDALAVHLHCVHVHHLETVFPAGLRQHGEIPPAFPAEAEIITDHEIAHLQTIHQQALDELLGLEGGKFRIERQTQHAIHRVAAQRLELFAQTRQARHGGLRLKKLLRLRLEQNHLRGQAEFPAFLRQLANHRLVTEMHAVEISDRGNASAMLRLEVMPPAYEFHAYSLKPKAPSLKVLFKRIWNR